MHGSVLEGKTLHAPLGLEETAADLVRLGKRRDLLLSLLWPFATHSSSGRHPVSGEVDLYLHWTRLGSNIRGQWPREGTVQFAQAGIGHALTATSVAIGLY